MGDIADYLMDQAMDCDGWDEYEDDWYLPRWRRIPTKRHRSPPAAKADEFEVNE